MTNKPTIKDSLLLCASDLQHSAIYDNHGEMQSCLRAVADRITALASVIEGVGRAALAAPAQAGEYQPSSADMVMAALDTEEWGLERMQRWDCLTDEGNREGAWLVKRQKAPYCADKPGALYGPRSWSGPTALDALQKAADDLGIHLPQPAARGPALAAPVDAAVLRDAERWQFLAEYLVSTRTDLDDEIVGCDSVQKMARVLDAAIAAQQGGGND